MPTLRTITLGCKVNQYETELVRQGLLRAGYRDAQDCEAADLCVVNTCTVTHEGDAKSRQSIRQLAKRNPGTRIVVMGCYATRAPEEVADLPNVAERDAIWSLYRSYFSIPSQQSRPDDTSWTGAEIKACCRLAALLDVPLTQAARNVVPVAVTAAESVDRLRTWATGRCLCANNPGIYTRDGTPPPKPARRVQRPSEN